MRVAGDGDVLVAVLLAVRRAEDMPKLRNAHLERARGSESESFLCLLRPREGGEETQNVPFRSDDVYDKKTYPAINSIEEKRQEFDHYHRESEGVLDDDDDPRQRRLMKTKDARNIDIEGFVSLPLLLLLLMQRI